MKLYEVSAEFLDFQAFMEDPEAELDENAVRDTLDSITGEAESKIEYLGKVVLNEQAEIKALKEEEQRLAKRRKSLENKTTWLKKYIFDNMKIMGLKEAGTVIKAKIAKNGGVLPLVFREGFDAKDAPDLYKRVEYSFDTEAIRAALDAGGTLDFVEYGERGESLRIK